MDSLQLILDLLDGLTLIEDPKQLAHMQKEMPVFFIAGGLDPVGESGKGVRRAYLSFKESGMKDVDIRIYPGLRHEILNEVGCEMVYDDVLLWLERQRERAQ